MFFDNSFIEIVMAFVFILSSSIMFLAFAVAALRFSRESRARIEHAPANPKPKPAPEETPVFQLKQLKEAANPRTIKLEIEFPELPEKITIPFEKLPDLLRMREEKVAEGVNHKIVVQKEDRGALRRYDNLTDILEKVSGLEFSDDGERVYCPRHGWTPYIVASDGRIICGEGHETLWDPSKDKYKPPSKQELLKLQKELTSLKKEIDELQQQAELGTPEQEEQENREKYSEEEEKQEESE